MIAFRLLVLIALVRLLIVTHKPLVCSTIYAVLVVLSGLLFGGQATAILVSGLIGFVTSTIYFWLLNRFDSSFIWWIILVAGALIGLV